MRPTSIATAALALCVCPFSLGIAGMPEVPEAIDEKKAALADVHLNVVDQKLALSLAVDTHMQIEMAELALESVQNEGLRRLLTNRLESQRAFATQLETLTEGRASRAIAEARQEIAKDAEGEDAGRFRLLDLRRNATGMLVRIRMEILQKYGQMVCDELEAKSAAEFDRHYLHSDLLHQMQMLATMEVLAGQASADFAQVIGHAATSAKEQLVLAQQLWLQLDTLPLAKTPEVPLVVETAAER
jgi:hypothetical protein